MFETWNSKKRDYNFDTEDHPKPESMRKEVRHWNHQSEEKKKKKKITKMIKVSP